MCGRQSTGSSQQIRHILLAAIQSLLVTCKLQGVDPYDYLVDVLLRISVHPAKDIALLTPRLWKHHFAANPLRSDLYSCRNNVAK